MWLKKKTVSALTADAAVWWIILRTTCFLRPVTALSKKKSVKQKRWSLRSELCPSYHLHSGSEKTNAKYLWKDQGRHLPGWRVVFLLSNANDLCGCFCLTDQYSKWYVPIVCWGRSRNRNLFVTDSIGNQSLCMPFCYDTKYKPQWPITHWFVITESDNGCLKWTCILCFPLQDTQIHRWQTERAQCINSKSSCCAQFGG